MRSHCSGHSSCHHRHTAAARRSFFQVARYYGQGSVCVLQSGTTSRCRCRFQLPGPANVRAPIRRPLSTIIRNGRYSVCVGHPRRQNCVRQGWGPSENDIILHCHCLRVRRCSSHTTYMPVVRFNGIPLLLCNDGRFMCIEIFLFIKTNSSNRDRLGAFRCPPNILSSLV